MPRKGQRRPARPLGDPTDPQGMGVLAQQFLDWAKVQNQSDQTIGGHRESLQYFIGWCSERGVTRPTEITRAILEHYQRFLANYRKQNGEPLKLATKLKRLGGVRAWFRWLAKYNHVPHNIAAELELPHREDSLPKCVLSESEAEQIINRIDLSEPLGIRDRAILETFYSTGIRRMELIRLKLHDVDAERGTLIVRQGKGNKDRVVPIGDRALLWLARYQWEVRPSLLMGDLADDVLFLTKLGQAFTPGYLSSLVAYYVKQAELPKGGGCHLWRHTMATLILENGADIRYIQSMLGHASLDTTQIYTRVSISKLKQVHDATHPAQAKRPPDDQAGKP